MEATGSSFEWVPVGAVSRLDRLLLARACEAEHSSLVTEDVLRLAIKGQAQIWRFTSGLDRGIFVTHILERVNGSELFVWLLVGRGIERHMKSIFSHLSVFGRANNCTTMGAAAKPGVARVCERTLGFKSYSVYISKKLEETDG